LRVLKVSYGRTSKKTYEQPPQTSGPSGKRFKPEGKSKAKDYEEQLSEKLEKSE